MANQSEIIDLMRPHMKKISVPGHFSPVFKSECQFSFDTPFSPNGLYVNLETHLAYAQDYLLLDHQRTGNCLYLHQKWNKVRKQVDPTEETPTKLAIGVDGGFQLDDQKYEVVKQNAVVLIPQGLRVEFPCADLPVLITQVVEAILNHVDTLDAPQITSWEDEVKESIYARDLVQVKPEKLIPSNPSLWKCEETGRTDNLWLNLSDGYIGGGRKNWDGSGGSGSALRHYEEMKSQGKNYPLAVKLGTITPHGADVYSYAENENEMVLDPYLAKHLEHWGINIMNMQKTEKTMAELQIDLNKNWEFDKITESGKDLERVFEPGCVGLKNLGSTCYINAVVQTLFTLPEVSERYLMNGKPEQFFHSSPSLPAGDILTQMAKLANGLLTDRYTNQNFSDPNSESSIRPTMFRTLVTKGHAEFSSGHQQDSGEFFQYLLETVKRLEQKESSRIDINNSIDSWFRFETEERYECSVSHKVMYKSSGDIMLGISIPIDQATNLDEVAAYEERKQKRQKIEEKDDDAVKPRVPFSACLSSFANTELINGFFSTATNSHGTATKSVRVKKFPKYLMVQLRRYYIASDWTPKKLDVLVDVPDVIDLEFLRAKGKQPHEELLPEQADGLSVLPPPTASFVPDELLVSQLMSMGFSENGSRRAAIATKNAGIETAAEWVFSHMADPDFNDPIQEQQQQQQQSKKISEDDVAILMAMGFSKSHSERSLRETGCDVERAVDWLFSHPEEENVSQPTNQPQELIDSGSTKYELIGFISHIGSNTSSGHYVCHIKKTGRWILFNDEKAAVSAKLPRDLGYLYLFKRI